MLPFSSKVACRITALVILVAFLPKVSTVLDSKLIKHNKIIYIYVCINSGSRITPYALETQNAED